MPFRTHKTHSIIQYLYRVHLLCNDNFPFRNIERQRAGAERMKNRDERGGEEKEEEEERERGRRVGKKNWNRVKLEQTIQNIPEIIIMMHLYSAFVWLVRLYSHFP